MDYPHRTVLLDDGRRDSIRQIATELGCNYVTRPDNVGHKAGNINLTDGNTLSFEVLPKEGIHLLPMGKVKA